MIATQKVNLITVMFINGHYDTQRTSNVHFQLLRNRIPCYVICCYRLSRIAYYVEDSTSITLAWRNLLCNGIPLRNEHGRLLRNDGKSFL